MLYGKSKGKWKNQYCIEINQETISDNRTSENINEILFTIKR